jgi:hypothetical protein
MQSIFCVIRKKRNLCRLSAIGFVFVMVIEIFSHTQTDLQIFAGNVSASAEAISLFNEGDEVSGERAVTTVEHESQGTHQTVC